MQAEGSSSNPFQEVYYYYNNGSGTRRLNLLQLMEAPDPQQDPLAQPDLNQETGPVSFVDLLTRERALSPPIHQGSIYQRSEGSMSSGIRHFSSGQSTFQGASGSGAILDSIDQNAAYANNSSIPTVLSSRTTQYEVENSVNWQNRSPDGRCFFFKRRAPEDDFGPISLVGSSSSQQAENYEQQAGFFEQLGVAAQGNARGRLNLNANITEQAGSSRRNVRLRTHEQQLSMPTNLPAWHSNGINVQNNLQPTLYFPYDPFPSNSIPAASFYTTPEVQPIAQGFNIVQNLWPMQLNGANMLSGFNHEQNSMDRASYMINHPDFMTPVFEPRYSENILRNMNMASPALGSMAHATRIIAAGPQAPSSSYPQTNWANPQRMETLIVNGSESGYHPRHGFHAAANQIGGVSDVGHGLASSSRESQRVVRRGARGPSPRIRSPTATERRRRLMNEVREALDNFRRVVGEHFRELIALGEQFEIIANELGQNQVVENGLTEDTIMARLSRETYHPTGSEEHRACSICQDEYAEGDLLGKLDCGHDYHFECIKQWVMRKNSCPMCRHRALAI